MKLTVLGNYGSFPGMDGACSGYLIQDANKKILIDCGNGTISRLQRYCRIEDLDMVILSHLHFDHMADIFPLKYAMETKASTGQNLSKIKLYLPEYPKEIYNEICNGNVFHSKTVTDGFEIETGSLRITFVRVPHLIESYAIIIKSGNKKLVYSGDTAYSDEIVKAAKGASLFLCESTLLDKTGGARLIHHMSAGAAGRAASLADVEKLMLTHFWYEEKIDNYLIEARRYFNNVLIAEQHSTYYV